MKIFLAEDNEDNYLIVKSNLERMDRPFELVHAGDGEEAISMLNNTALTPDIFLIDIAMPKIDGLALLRWIKTQEHLKHIPSVAMTASVFAEMKESYQTHGFSKILEKPFTRKEFANLLDRLID